MPLDAEAWKKRAALWDAMWRYMDAIHDDYLPSEPFYQAFTKMLIVNTMFHSFQRGQTSSVTEIARRSGVPRQTVVRKLAELTNQGIVERRGRRYIPIASFFNRPGSTLRFRKRRAIIKQALEDSA